MLINETQTEEDQKYFYIVIDGKLMLNKNISYKDNNEKLIT